MNKGGGISGFRIRLQRQMALGEVYEIECRTFEDASRAAAFLDNRLWTLNQRVLQLNAATGKLPPEQLQTIANILAGLAGIQLPAPDEEARTRSNAVPAR